MPTSEVTSSGVGKHTMMLANSIIGASILSMPFCFKQCGIILGSILLYFNSVMTKICCHQLIKSSLIARRKSYEVLAFDTMGAIGKFWVEVSIIGYLMGCCIAYFVVLGDLGPEVLTKLNLNYSLYWSRIALMTGVGILVILPLSLLRDIESLNVMSTISVAIYLLLVIKSMYEAWFEGVTHGISPNIELWKSSGILQCVPIFSMALSCQTQVFEVYDSLPEPSLKVMDQVISSAVNLCTFIYLGVGICGYLAFADTEFTGNILVSFQPTIVTDVMKAGFLLSIVLSFPLCVLPCRTSLHSLIYGRITVQQDSITANGLSTGIMSNKRFRLLTFVIVALTLLIGVSIPNVEFVLGLVGSTLGTAICSVAPAWIYLKVAPPTSTERITAKVVLIIGLVILLLGTTANIYAEEEYSESHPALPIVPLAKENIASREIVDRIIPETVLKVPDNNEDFHLSRRKKRKFRTTTRKPNPRDRDTR